MLAFFDQYSRSHSPWAPDGSGLVVSGTQQYLSERRNGSGAGGARVYVTETAAGGGLHDIAGGGIAKREVSWGEAAGPERAAAAARGSPGR